MKLIGQETIVAVERRPALVHCSSLLATGGGLVSVWYEGAYETSSNMRLMISRRRVGSAWLPAKVLFDFHGLGLGNPVLWRSSEGEMRLTFSVLLAESWKESMLFVSSSRDEGTTWSAPALFVPRKGMMAKTRPIYGDGGQLIFPLYDEAQYCPYIWLLEDSADPLGGSFVAETMARGKAIQPVLARLAGGRILMVCRTNQGTLWQSYSSNDGYTWTILRPTGLPNPDSAVDMIRLRDGRLLLACNPSSVDRKRLLAFLSTDEGASWSEAAEIVSGEGEYSYPSLLEEEDGTISVSYTFDRRAIVHARMAATSGDDVVSVGRPPERRAP